jgi:hypothetical protein
MNHQNDDTNIQQMYLPTHENFRIMALANPVPPFVGRTIDPPLRSRFQIRRIDPPGVPITTAEKSHASEINHHEEDDSMTLPHHTKQPNSSSNLNQGLQETVKSMSQNNTVQSIQQRIILFLTTLEQYMMENLMMNETHESLISRNNNTRDLSSSSSILMFPALSCYKSIMKLITTFPHQDPVSLLIRYYPTMIPLSNHTNRNNQVKKQGNDTHQKMSTSSRKNASSLSSPVHHPFWFALQHAKLFVGEQEGQPLNFNGIYGNDIFKNSYEMKHITRNIQNPAIADVTFHHTNDSKNIKIETEPVETTLSIPCGKLELNRSSSSFVPTGAAKDVLTGMIQEHYVDRDILLLSQKGNGKTFIWLSNPYVWFI